MPTELNNHLTVRSSDKRNELSSHYLSHRPYLHITFHNETLYIIEKFGHIDPTDIIYMLLLFLRHLSRELVFESTPVEMGHCGDRTHVQPSNPALRVDVLPTELNDHLADLSSDKRNEPSSHYLSHRPSLLLIYSHCPGQSTYFPCNYGYWLKHEFPR